MDLKIIPLGGVEEIGINCTVFEHGDDIVIVDMGAGFPDNEMYGVDLLVPNPDYLEKRKDRIRGLVLTHGHLDHIGAIQHILEKIGYPPIYGSHFTIELLKAKLEETEIAEKAKLNVIDERTDLNLGTFNISFFRVNHSIPQCLGVVLKTPSATAVHTGDFKFDNSPVNEPVADYSRIADVGKDGVTVLLSDSTNSLRKGHPISEGEVANSLEQVIETAKGRVIVASFSGLVGRLYQVMAIAQKLNRKIAIAGYSMNQTLRIAREIGYINPPADLIIPINKVNRYHENRLLILTTGAQGEGNAALSKMASGDYKNIRIKEGDTVIISAGTIPGNNRSVQLLIDAIYARGGKVHQSEHMDFFTSGHGYQEDQKIMINLIRPKFFIPVHGYQYFLLEHANTAMQVGLKKSNILIPKKGGVISVTNDSISITGDVKSQPLLVSGSGVGDVGAVVLAERQQLGRHGVVVINAQLQQKTLQIVGEPEITTKGFVYTKSSGELLSEIRDLVIQTISKRVKSSGDLGEIRKALEDKLSDFVHKQIGRDPMFIISLSKTESNRHRPETSIRSPRKSLHRDNQEQHPQPQPTAEQVASKWNIPQDAMDIIIPRTKI